MHTDIGESANRIVFTFTGEPLNVTEAAFNMVLSAKEIIGMSNHVGSHPHIGAVDVCPFVPVKGIPMKETEKYTDVLASKIGATLNVPVYLYDNSSRTEARV